MYNFTNISDINRTETLEELNARFADALLPLTVTFGFFTVFGFAGNLLILLVFTFSREYRKNNFKVFVLTLAIIDIITCMTLIPAEMIKQRHYFDFGDAISCKIKCFFNLFGACASCMALLVISVDRFRKVVHPMKKQMSQKVAIGSIMLAAFVFPIVIAVPGTVMCGIEKANKTNIYGGFTEIHLCSANEKYQHSIWRRMYKLVLIILLVGISLTYIILYTFVMREVCKQLKTIASQRKNSSFEVTYSSDIYDPNSVIVPDDHRESTKLAETDHFVKNPSIHQNGSLNIRDAKKKKASRQFSMRSIKSMKGHVPLLQRAHFPSKTMIWFILTIVFVVTYVAHNILALYVGEVVFMSPEQFTVYSFFFRIYFFNHMINPVVYAIFVKRFRDSCKTLIPTIKKRILEWRG